jgi:hypothetical protein
MSTLTPRVTRVADARHPPVRPRAAAPALAFALAVALIVTLGVNACATLGSALGFGGSSHDASVEIRNTADIGVNLYMMPRAGLQEVFLGQVGPKRSRRIQVPRHTPGDTVWLRARPIDGRPEYARNDIVLGREAVWQIP